MNPTELLPIQAWVLKHVNANHPTSGGLFLDKKEAERDFDTISPAFRKAEYEIVEVVIAPAASEAKQPWRITLCGSTKFKKEFEAINRQLTLEGNVVYTVAFFGHADSVPLTNEQKETLDAVHLKKIDNSDAVFVVDVDGYIGESTRNEINYAELQGKTVKYLSRFPDLKMLCDSVTLSLSHPTPPASKPSEQPVADALKEERIWKLIIQEFKSGLKDEQELLNEIEKYARHASARAVEDERQRLLRLVDEEVHRLESIYTDGSAIPKVKSLLKVRQWLTGDVGEKK